MYCGIGTTIAIPIYKVLPYLVIHNVCWLTYAVCLCSMQDRYKCKKGFTVQIATCEDNVEDCRVFVMLLLTNFGQQKNMRKRSNTSTECGKYTYTRVRNAESIPIVYYCYRAVSPTGCTLTNR